MAETKEEVGAIADAILANLLDRKGFDWWWHDLDADIQQDIRDEIIRTIQNGLGND